MKFSADWFPGSSPPGAGLASQRLCFQDTCTSALASAATPAGERKAGVSSTRGGVRLEVGREDARAQNADGAPSDGAEAGRSPAQP